SIISEKDCIKEESEGFLNKVFNGSLNSMVINFVKSQKLTEDEINELKSILDNSQNTVKK
ncbi:BlaI/MecI/CopY family transcriptional regulator, partial [uncultured Clostridium sp.]